MCFSVTSNQQLLREHLGNLRPRFKGRTHQMGPPANTSYYRSEQGSKLCHVGDTFVGLHREVIQKIRHERELEGTSFEERVFSEFMWYIRSKRD